jgi:DNA-binding SARP family transcriptional activator
MSLSARVVVDIEDTRALAHKIIDFDRSKCMLPQQLLRLVSRFEPDLLPDWYDDWLVVERERFLQLRLHALEVISELLARDGYFAEAIEAGLLAVAGDPVRESAHRAVIRVHSKEGNAAGILRQYNLCRKLLGDLGLEPSPQTRELVSRHLQATAVS